VSDHKSPVDQAIDLAVYAPIGLAVLARDLGAAALAELAKRGRSEVDQAQKQLGNQITQYRFVGQYAVDQEIRPKVEPLIGELRKAFERFTGTSAPTPSAPFVPNPASPPAMANGHVTGAAGAPPSPERTAVDFAAERAAAAALPIPDYDELSASQVVERLAGLTPSELEAVAGYESARRRRKTILSRIEQLTR
jgi:hypothetical protein